MATSAKGAGRPKASPTELRLRRIGKHFEAADQFLLEYQENTDNRRQKGGGKQPFNAYIKSLQEKLAMYKAYLEMVASFADKAGYEVDTDIVIEDQDKERPWDKLKQHFRDANDNALSLKDELKERRIAFDGSRTQYNKSYPYNEWNGFWLEAELNAAERLASSAIMSFDMMGISYMTIDECLASTEAKKGRKTFVNKQGKNTNNEHTQLHASIVRHTTRLKNALDEFEMSLEDATVQAVRGLIASKDKSTSKKGKQIFKLKSKIQSMEDELTRMLAESSEADQVRFDIAMAKKERLPLVKLENANKITPIQRIKLAKLDQEIESLRETLKSLEEQAA